MPAVRPTGAFVQIAILAIFAVAIVGGMFVLIPNLPRTPATEMGGLIVLSVLVLLVLLFILTSGFAFLDLSARSEALGLPPGSIRALIALLLLMIFVFFSLYLYGQVVDPPLFCREALTPAQRDSIIPTPVLTYPSQDDPSKWVACIRLPTSEAGERFAQQIFTAVATLATAVASFYFGSRSVEAAVAATGSAPTPLTVIGVNPATGEAGRPVTITNLAGTGFADGAEARLTRSGSNDVVATDVEVITPNRIICRFDLAGTTPGKWDLVVKNPDGKQARRPEAFDVQTTSDTATVGGGGQVPSAP